MHNYQHKELVKKMSGLDVISSNPDTYADWISAKKHLTFLQENANDDEIAIYASGENIFIHSVVVPNAKLFPVNQDDLMVWSLSPFKSISSYISGGGREEIWIEKGLIDTGVKAFDGAIQLVFGRTFEGWSGLGRNYFEVNQEYSHINEIHWRPERRAYCRFDNNGDIEPVVSITTREDNDNIALVSFMWEPLEEYLAASQSSLVRMFDFTLLRLSEFNGWSNNLPKKYFESNDLFYHQSVMPNHAAYTRGVQIVKPRRPEKIVFADIKKGWLGEKNTRYVEFIAYDWRNNRISNISTDPSTTTNYFNTEGNSLPFELSPAFFKPEVLLKYKADKEKYTVGEREVSCRASWRLKGIDVNEAGQVHAYICDLRNIPYNEQLHWLSFNEPPKTDISRRAFVNDIKGDWDAFVDPLQKVLGIIRLWNSKKVLWWALRDESLIDHVNTPVTDSRDEWAEAFMDLAKLVVEGFEIKPIRAKLDKANISYKEEDKTITLLEKLLNNGDMSSEAKKLNGLRSVQFLRSKVKGHVGGSEAKQLAQDALMTHETFGNHFKFICAQVADELEAIEHLLL